MSLHDEYARVTPFEIALRSEEREAELVAAVESEAEARGVDPRELGTFLTLGSVEAFVREIASEEADGPSLHRFGPLAYHGVRFAAAGRPLYLLSTHVARYLVEGVPDGDPMPPTVAGYLQLPQHLFWTRAAGDSPESVDGVFWSRTPEDFLRTLLVTGMRPDRPGLGVVSLPPAPLDDASRWLKLEVRETDDDFSTDLPGAEIDALYEILATGEALKLLARFFAYVSASPDVLEARRGPGPSGFTGDPEPSRLDYARVTLGVR